MQNQSKNQLKNPSDLNQNSATELNLSNFFSPSKIAMVATASVGEKQDVEKAAALLPNIFNIPLIYGTECYDPEINNNPKLKAERFLAYCLDDSVSHLWSCRGGEGSGDILPYLYAALPQLRKIKPKVLIGFSDFTVILVFFAQHLGWPAVHGMGALQFVRQGPAESTIQKTIDLIKHQTYQNYFNPADLVPLNQTAKQNINNINNNLFQAPITGGNLTLLMTSIKDCWEIETDHRILCLEDWNIKGYQAHRALKYLDRIGKLKHLRALILGDFAAGQLSIDPIEQANQERILKNKLIFFAEKNMDPLNIPVFQTPRVGHGEYNDPWILGQQFLLNSAL